MAMPGRTYSAAGAYRYGFNGKENDNEVKGEGNQQDYGMRIYDPRLGKFLSVDPITADYPELTPYQFAANTPIMAIDLDGLENFPYLGARDYISGGKAELKVYTAEDGKNTGVYTFKEHKREYRMAEYRTNIVDKGAFNYYHSRNIYFIQDKTIINQSDFEVGDGSIIRTKGTSWHYWMSSNDISQAAKVIGKTADGIGAGVYVGAVIGAAIPAAIYTGVLSLGSKSIGFRLANGGADLASQLSFNGFDINKVNWTSVLSNAAFKNPFTAAGVGSGFEYSTNDGFKNSFFFGEKKASSFLFETGVGGLFNHLAGKGFDSSPGFSYEQGKNTASFIWNFWGNAISSTTSLILAPASKPKQEKSIPKSMLRISL